MCKEEVGLLLGMDKIRVREREKKRTNGVLDVNLYDRTRHDAWVKGG